MVITVRAIGTVMNHMPKMAEQLTLSFAETVSVADVISQLGLPDYAIWIMTVNGDKVELTHVLRDGDLLSLYAPVAGG
ncbi:MAG: MoaD/ThiS family protein [Bacillota bacterium]